MSDKELQKRYGSPLEFVKPLIDDYCETHSKDDSYEDEEYNKLMEIYFNPIWDNVREYLEGSDNMEKVVSVEELENIYVNVNDIENQYNQVIKSLKDKGNISLQQLIWTIMDLEEEKSYLENEIYNLENEKPSEDDYFQEGLKEYNGQMAIESMNINRNNF